MSATLAQAGPASSRLPDSPSIPISPKGRERPLPPLPDAAQSPSPSKKSVSIPPVSAVAAGKRRARPVPSLLPSEALHQILKNPHILSRLLAATQWQPFHALISTCKDFRQIYATTPLRDVILSRFVPGYRQCLGNREIEGLAVDITIEDIALFQLSQNVPLHIYPMHAMAILGSPRYQPEIPPTDPYTVKVTALAQAHTRVVLLLQSLVHSGHGFASHVDSDDFALMPSGSPGVPVLPGVRELVFPKPLAVYGSGLSHQKASTDVPVPTGRAGRRASTGTLRRYSSAQSRASQDYYSLRGTSRTRNPLKPVISVLARGPKVPYPPPSSSPPALGYYVGTWRRTLVQPRRAASGSSAVSDDEDETLPRPRVNERRSSSLYRSADSSAGSSSPSSSRSQTHTDYTTDASSVSPRETTKHFNSHSMTSRLTSSSPHDVSMACSRFRAPILRVFVPCTQLDEVAITACEEQLMDSGLWRHLSAGDIVCNFGFVPPPEPDNASQSSKTGNGYRRRWLLFNGYCLVHYIPPSPPPVENCLTLPSPFYFSHILPAFSDPRFILALPPLPSNFMAPRAPRGRSYADGPYAQLVLSHVRTRVSSPHSPGGYAVVKKYIWLARIPYVGPHSRTEAGEALGEGWQGEWVLEAEGTKEGRQTLLDAVQASADGTTQRGLWEVARDKSGGGRIWMRLITPNIDSRAHAALTDSPHSSD